MIAVRRSEDRGHRNHGWLDTRYTFSFSDYLDPRYMGFRDLRVINEDWVEARRGFGTHPHRDMEILTYVMEGAIQHRDSMGNGSIIRAGDVQRMTAGSGVTHSEINPRDEALHLLQIWIEPDELGLEPGYEQRSFDDEAKRGRLLRIASKDGADGAVRIHQDVSLYATVLADGESVEHELAEGRAAWVQVTRGSIELDGELLGPGDGAAVSEAGTLRLAGKGGDELSEALLFDLR